MTQPTDRLGIDQLTSDMLDQLYDELWHLRLAQAGADLALQAACRMTEEQRVRADRAEAAITAVRKLHQPQPDGSGFPDSHQCTTCSQNGGDGYQYLVPYPCPTVAVLGQHDQTTT